MMRLRRFWLTWLVTLSAVATPTMAGPAPEVTAIEHALRQALPSTAIDAIRSTPIAGLLEVVAGHNVLYADTSGRWLLVGHLYDLQRARDVTAERKTALARLSWADLPLEAAVHYGTGPLKLAVFSDPDCGWCRKLSEALRQAEGIAVWEIMFPVPALHPGARDTAVRILCHAQPAEALEQVMSGQALGGEAPGADCIDGARGRVDRALAFGRAHGIEGTPTLVAFDGRVHRGYLPLEALRRWLEEGARQTPAYE